MARTFLPSLSVLEEFFGTAPELEYSGIPVESNNIEFSADLENGSVWFKLIASQCRGELRLVAKPFSIVKLVLVDISRVTVRKTAEDHCLRISFAGGGVDRLTLWLRPKVLLFWGNERGAVEERKQNVRSASEPDDA